MAHGNLSLSFTLRLIHNDKRVVHVTCTFRINLCLQVYRYFLRCQFSLLLCIGGLELFLRVSELCERLRHILITQDGRMRCMSVQLNRWARLHSRQFVTNITLCLRAAFTLNYSSSWLKVKSLMICLAGPKTCLRPLRLSLRLKSFNLRHCLTSGILCRCNLVLALH